MDITVLTLDLTVLGHAEPLWGRQPHCGAWKHVWGRTHLHVAFGDKAAHKMTAERRSQKDACHMPLNFHRVLKEFRSRVHFWGGCFCCSSACFLQWFDEMGSKMSRSSTTLFVKLWYDFYKDLWNTTSRRRLFPNRFLSSFLHLFSRFRWNLNVFWDHFSLRCGLLLEKSLRCGDASSDACDALETACHFCCNLGSAMRSCDAHRAICNARCGTAKSQHIFL